MTETVRWIRDGAALREVIASLGSGPLALDTEADSLHHYPEKVCLLQISFSGRDFLVDPLTGMDLAEFAGPLADPGLRTILHGADYDLRMLRRDFGLELRGIFDTMIAARLIGERAFGLAALLDRFLGIGLDKRFQRADWSLRPLPADMQAYAVSDTRYLEELAERITKRLDELGRRSWAEEEFRRLEDVRFSTEKADPEAFRKIKKIGRLAPRQLAVLRSLHAFRESEARARDRPPFKILRNEVLVDIATRMPATGEALSGIGGLPRRFGSGSARATLLDVIQGAASGPAEGWPEARVFQRTRPDPAFEAALRELQTRRDGLAEKLQLEPSVLASRSVLTAIQERLDRGESAEDAPDLRRWQWELLEPLLSA